MKRSRSLPLSSFWNQKKVLFLLFFYFLKINGALVSHPQQQFPQFQEEGFQTKYAFDFKENLSIISNCFDATGKALLKELNRIVRANDTQKTRESFKKSPPNNNVLWQSYSNDNYFQFLSFHEKFAWYFENERSEYRTKLDEFKQAKSLLLEIIRYISHETFFENALLELDQLVNQLGSYKYQNPKIDLNIHDIVHETIESKIVYVQEKIIHIALIIEFKNKLFRFLQNYFEIIEYKKRHSLFSQYDPLLYLPSSLNYDEQNPLIIKYINKEEQETWEYHLNIKNYFGYFTPFDRFKITTHNAMNTVSNFVQNPKKMVKQFFFKNETIKTGMHQTQQTIKTCNTNLLNFADIDMPQLADQIRLITGLLTVANKPAVWKFSTFVIKILPRVFINAISTQPKVENNEEKEKNLAEEKKKLAVEKLNLAVETLKKGKKDTESISKILEHLISAAASFSPAIAFLNEIQRKVFDNSVPHAFAEQIFAMRDFLIECSKLVEEKVDILKGVRQTLDADAKNQCMAQQITSYDDWANVFKVINKNTKNEFRKEFYKYCLPVLPFLTLKKKNEPMIDADDEFFYSSNTIITIINAPPNASIQNHLSKLYQYIDEIDWNYLQKVDPILALQQKIDLRALDSDYSKMLLFLASLKNVKSLFKAINKNQPTTDNDINAIEKTNFEKIFCTSFPGTQNLLYSIKNLKYRLQQEITKRDKFKPEYDKAQEFLRQLNVNAQFFQEGIQTSNGSYAKRAFTKIAFLVFKFLSFFIDKGKLLIFCDKFNSLGGNIVFQENYNDFLNEHENQKKSAEQAVKEYEKIDPLIHELNQIINDKENMYTDLKNFRKPLKAEIDRVWSLG